MPKRIQLPSADELFAPKPRTPAPDSAAGPATPRVRRAAPRKAVAKPPARRTAALLENLEGRLPELPIDTLIDLRDGLEELLIAESVDAVAVDRLLATLAL